MKLFLAVILVLFAATAYGEVWGSTKSRIYHYRLCRWNAQIKQEYKISFSSPVTASKAGYLPCSKCRPPAAESRYRSKPAEKERPINNSY